MMDDGFLGHITHPIMFPVYLIIYSSCFFLGFLNNYNMFIKTFMGFAGIIISILLLFLMREYVDWWNKRFGKSLI